MCKGLITTKLKVSSVSEIITKSGLSGRLRLIKLHFVGFHQLAQFPNVKGARRAPQEMRIELLVFPADSKNFLYWRTAKCSGSFSSKRSNIEVNGGLKFRVVLAGFRRIYHFKQRRKVFLVLRGFVPDVADKGAVKSRSDFTQKSSPDFSPSPLVLAIMVFTSFKISFSLRR